MKRENAVNDECVDAIELTRTNGLQDYYRNKVKDSIHDFIGTAKTVLTQKHREGLRKLLGFKFKKNSRYNLPDKRLKMLEKMIQARAKLLLDR